MTWNNSRCEISTDNSSRYRPQIVPKKYSAAHEGIIKPTIKDISGDPIAIFVASIAKIVGKHNSDAIIRHSRKFYDDLMLYIDSNCRVENDPKWIVGICVIVELSKSQEGKRLAVDLDVSLLDLDCGCIGVVDEDVEFVC